MRGDDYTSGSDALGAGLFDAGGAFQKAMGAGGANLSPASTGEGPFLTIHVRNLPDLVHAQAGAKGSVAQQVLPGFVEKQVYDTIKSNILDGLRQNKVDADVSIVSGKPAGGPLQTDFYTGIAVGGGIIGVVWGLVKLFSRKGK